MKDLQLTKTNENKFLRNLLVFLSPVAVIYLVAVVGVINANNGAVKLTDFIPTSFTLGAMTLYALNSILDYLRKLKWEKWLGLMGLY